MTQRLDSLQAVRAIAALLVVFFHAESIFLIRANITPFGGNFLKANHGVDLFFVLSGFIMVYIHRTDIGNAKRFYNFLYTRAARIYPLVWIMSVFAILVYATGTDPAKLTKLAFQPLLGSIFLLPQQAEALVNVTWTLKYEIFFYLLFSTLFLNRTAGFILLAAWQLAALALCVFNIDTWPLWGFYLRPIVLEFGIGMAAGWLGTSPLKSKIPHAAAIILLLVGVAAFLTSMITAFETYDFLSYGVPAGLIIFACAAIETSSTLKIPAFIILLGDASYAIYLIHYSVITLGTAALQHQKFLPLDSATAAGLSVIAIAIGLIFYKCADQPIQKHLQTLKRHLFPRPGHVSLQPVRNI